MNEIILNGIPAAPGIAIGEVFLFRHDIHNFREYEIEEQYREKELKRFEQALDETKRQLRALYARMSKLTGETVARIFDAQAAILDDIEFMGIIRSEISEKGLNAETLVYNNTKIFHDTFASMDDVVFRDKAQDVMDVGRRVIKNLLGKVEAAIGPLKKPAILVTDDLLPSDVVHLLREKVQAVAADLGGATSHTAILTRSLEVPSIVGLKGLVGITQNGDQIIVNGNSGKVILNPSEETRVSYSEKLKRYGEYRSELNDIELLPAVTTDNHKISLKANIELPEDAKSARSHGAEGIGLFRSEYLFLTRNVIPDEDAQLNDYRQVVSTLAPSPVTIRTFDLGGDKVFTDMPLPVESNPFMGWRAVRVSLDQPALLRTQLRAILRASNEGSVKIMFPLVSGLSEVRRLLSFYEQVKEDLKNENCPVSSDIKIGVMIELPSAALMAESLAREVDFFSIGTNDLTQFTLAVDRSNEKVHSMFRPLHPAVIKLIKMTIDAGHSAGITVAICGELAANPLATMLLVGLGIDELSVSPLALGEIKKIIRSMSFEEAEQFANEALRFDNYIDLEHFCVEAMKHRFADLPIWFSGG